MPNKSFKHIVRHGLRALTRRNVSRKEQKRFIEIYKTVYQHARNKGQTHKQALNYCWNVYSEQAAARPKHIIKGIMSENMRVERSHLRKAILEMLEGEVVNMSDYMPAPEPIEPETEIGPLPEFESFLSDVHTQILDFMEENFETLTSEQQVFLDKMLDKLEKELGIEDEASFDFGDEEEVIADVEDED